ncbi:acyltransferase family protein [uncultured Alistipes sp.]|jgi:O-actetyl transferase related protein|uniref:acyltransferase family protein n=1 Tax=uncultured Alistipes sp. TaxID=538949 RepID=UPI0025D2C37E|nr:acyltransferase family protein [uncultured Alistipes sp.]
MFSIAKAIGILAVVVSHAAITTPLETFAYYFNTAIFFFVAGYFFNDAQTAHPGQFIRRKLLRLYLPFVVIGVVFVLLHNKFLEWHLIAYNFSTREALPIYDGPELLRRLCKVLLFLYHEQMLAPFWFLRGLFLGLMLFFGVTLVSQKLTAAPRAAERLRGACILTLFIIAILLTRYRAGIPGEKFVITTFVITGIMYLGKLYAIYRERIRLDNRLAIACFAILITATALHYRINIGAGLYGNPALFLLVVCAGCYMVLTLASRLAAAGNGITRAMDYIGRHTLAIMLWHVPLFKLVNLLQIWIYDYPIRYLAGHPVIGINIKWWWIAYTIVGIGIPLGICLLYDRLRAIRSARR